MQGLGFLQLQLQGPDQVLGQHRHPVFIALTFAVGAALPLVAVLLLPTALLMGGLAASSLCFLALLGLLAARAGGSPLIPSVIRVTFWGALAMGLTAGVGALFGVAA